jgi:predicted O-methyltransferase YrrM
MESVLNKMHAAAAYLRYRFRSGNAHGLHSPFVFDLYNNVIRDDMPYYTFEPIELLRNKILQDNRRIEVLDFGAGGRGSPVKTSTVKKIASRSLNTPEYGRLLFRLINHFKPGTIVELGTSLGITTLYLSIPNSETKVFTVEGSPEIRHYAQTVFEKLNRSNITSLEGPFENVIPELLEKIEHVDMVYFDGNHRYAPTMNYFRMFLPKKKENSFFVFDDIYWSQEMTSAWEEIKAHPEVTVTIDLYRMGIAFFRKGILKQDFVLKY